MAPIPTIFYLGDVSLNGASGDGQAPQPGAIGRLFTNSLNSPRLMQTVPSDGTAFAPWWDGTAGVQLNSSGATNFTVTVSPSPGWATNEHAGKTVYVDSGVGKPVLGVQQKRTIVSNTADTLTVSVAWTTNPTASVIHVGTGRWVKYDHIATSDAYLENGDPFRVPMGTNGDNWYASDVRGFGASALLMQELKDRYPTAPWFRLFKYASPVGAAGWSDIGGATWASFTAEYAKAQAAAVAEGNTLVPTVLIVDASMTDIENANAGYGGHIVTLILNLRTLFGNPSLPVVLVNHATGIRRQSKTFTTGGVTIPLSSYIRGVHAQLRGLVTNLRLADMEGQEFQADSFAHSVGFPGLFQPGTVSTDPKGYSTTAHLTLARKLFRDIVSFTDPGPVVPVGAGIPTLVLLGDSQGVGFTPPTAAILGGQASLLGSTPLSTVMGTQLIWDGAEEQIEPYDLASNDNTLGTVTAQFYGPSATFLRRFGTRFPNGVLLLKLAVGGASITLEALSAGASSTYDPAADSLWPQLQAAWAKLKADGTYVLDVLGVACLVGDNDAGSAAVAAALAEKLPSFAESLRALFTTRTTGPALPIAFQLPPEHVDNGGTSVLGTGAGRAAMRAALRAFVATDDRAALTSDADLELRRDDRIHYAGEANHEVGTRLADALITLIDATGAVGSGSDDGGSTEDAGTEDAGTDGAAELVVEDGTGLPDAESLCSIEQLDEFWTKNGAPAHVTAATDDAKAAALRRATREWVEGIFGGAWRGRIQFADQRLSFPREGCYDDDGRRVLPGTVPWQFVEATAIVAGHILGGGSVLPNGNERGQVVRETKRGLGFEKTIEYAEMSGGGGSSAVAQIRQAEALVYPFIAGHRPGVSRS